MAGSGTSLPWDRRSPGDPRVEAELKRRLRARGRITFAEFMEVALYLPGGGYYEAHAAIGRRGDFLTSPECHPVFGALLARLAAAMWSALGSRDAFAVIEYGAGTGSLCRQLLEAAPKLDPAFGRALHYQIIEASSYLRRRQQAGLADLSDRCEWISPDERSRTPVACVIANELVDALPVHRVRMRDGELEELYVELSGDQYVEAPAAPSHPELAAFLRAAAMLPPEGGVVEIGLAAEEWLRAAADRVERGYLVTIDFGGSAGSLYASATPRGGLKCFHRHGWTDDPFDRPGLQDITAPVDFTSLAASGEAVGLRSVLEVSQRRLLRSLGVQRCLDELEAGDLPVQEREGNRRAMLSLCARSGLGDYRVLIQAKGAPDVSLTRLGPGTSLWCPLRPAESTEWPD